MTTDARDDIEQEVAQVLERAAAPFSPKARERALQAMTGFRSGQAGKADRAGTKGMRRLGYVLGAMVILAALAAVVVPWRGDRADAFTVLTAAAQAAEQANSIRIVRGPTDRVPPGTPLTFFMSGWGGPHTEERLIAAGPHSVRRLDMHDGSLFLYFVQDADTGEYSFYDRREKTLYTADLRPLQPIATQVVAHNAKETWKSEQFEEQLAQLKQSVADKAMQQSVTDGAYSGRKCQVVTIGWTVAKVPKLITSRLAFYLDPDTKRPFAERQYLKVEGQPERMIGNIVKIEYDVPFPPRDRILFPPGTKEVRCTGRLTDVRNRFGHAVGFELLAGERRVAVGSVHVPD